MEGHVEGQLEAHRETTLEQAGTKIPVGRLLLLASH
jgi:hypothetical protein